MVISKRGRQIMSTEGMKGYIYGRRINRKIRVTYYINVIGWMSNGNKEI